jgi:hypothetical protein
MTAEPYDPDILTPEARDAFKAALKELLYNSRIGNCRDQKSQDFGKPITKYFLRPKAFGMALPGSEGFEKEQQEYLSFIKRVTKQHPETIKPDDLTQAAARLVETDSSLYHMLVNEMTLKAVPFATEHRDAYDRYFERQRTVLQEQETLQPEVPQQQRQSIDASALPYYDPTNKIDRGEHLMLAGDWALSGAAKRGESFADYVAQRRKEQAAKATEIL